MTVFPAHIRYDDTANGPQKIEQSVKEHCEATGRYAAQCLSPAGLSEAGRLAGLVHDMGKETCASAEYQERVAKGEPVKRGSVNHTFAGVRYLLEHYHGPTPSRHEDVVCELLAYAAGAHHGLFDCVDGEGKNGFLHRLEKRDIGYEEASANYLADCFPASELDTLFTAASKELWEAVNKLLLLAQGNGELSFYLGLLARLLLSAVIEGDRRDTAEFLRGVKYPPVPDDVSAFWLSYLQNLEDGLRVLPKDTPVAEARGRLSELCREAAGKPGGVYRLDMPTGAGKTLSALRFALAHASIREKRRIFYVSPLLTILGQNAKTIRAAIGDDSILLEHHSNVVNEGLPDGELDERELLCENWHAPVILTTLVQMLDAMFSGSTTCVRRFQALCGSVIIFDEVQSVPTKLLSQFNLTVSFLAEVCGATVVLCSATQPCFELARRAMRTPIVPLIPVDPPLWEVFRRTRIEPLGSMTLEEIAAFAREEYGRTESLLLVCNTRAQARELYQALHDLQNVRHLSAAMCPAHRNQALDDIRAKLGKEKVLCVSTQIIEAGVDISFARVIRLTAGMDSVVQAAGRENRSGEAGEISPVYLVSCYREELRYLDEIRRARDVTEGLLDRFQQNPQAFDNDLASNAAVGYYYKTLYEQTAGRQDCNIAKPFRTSLFELLSDNTALCSQNTKEHPSKAHAQFCLRQAFCTAGAAFTVFDQDTLDVVTPYGKGKELIEALCSRADSAKYDYEFLRKISEKARPYCISLYRYQRPLAYEVIPGVFILREGCYSDETGLIQGDVHLDFKEA